MRITYMHSLEGDIHQITCTITTNKSRPLANVYEKIALGVISGQPTRAQLAHPLFMLFDTSLRVKKASS